MRKNKLFALVLLVAALASAGILKKGADRRAAETAAGAIETRALNKGLSAAFVQRIELEQAEGEKIALSKDASGEWKIESRFGVPARRQTVEDLVAAFSDLEGEVRAASPDLAADFKLDEKNAVSAVFRGTDGTEAARIYVSPIRPNRVENFVRAAGSPEALAVKKDLLSAMGIWNRDSKLDYKTFADMKAVRFEIPKIERIEFAGGKTLLRASDPAGKANASDPWNFEGAGPADPAKTNRFVIDVSNLYGTEILDPASVKNFPEKPSFTLVEKEAGRRIEVFITPPDPASKTAAVRSGELVFSAPEGALAPLRRSAADFVQTAEKTKP